MLLDHVPIEASGVERLDAKRAVQYALYERSEDVSDIQSEGDSSHSMKRMGSMLNSTLRLVRLVI
eukprot:8720269-Pyramimonas_sp.AAC.1